MLGPLALLGLLAAPTKPVLAAEIRTLIDTALSDDSAPGLSTRVRQIFKDHGVPTTAMVGEEAAEDYVILGVHEQPIQFMEDVLAAIQRLPAAAVPPNATTFLRARLRQKRINEALPQPSAAELRDRIERLIGEDQGVRKEHASDPASWSDVDKRTLVALREIFADHGMPSASMVGPEAAQDFVVMVQHQPPDFMRQVLPRLEEQVRRGEADPADFAMMFDRMQMYDGRKQHYGSNFECRSDRRFVPTPIEAPTSLDARRAAIGLMPMRLYMRFLLGLYPKDFCEKAIQAPPDPR